MALRFLDTGSVQRAITKLRSQDGSNLRTIKRLQFMDGATLRTVAAFAPAMTVSASPVEVFGTGSSSGSITVTTSTTLVTPSGGVAPYRYSWSVLGDDNPIGSVVATAPSSAITAFSMTNVEPSAFYTATVLCTVTDFSGQSANVTVTAYFNNENFS